MASADVREEYVSPENTAKVQNEAKLTSFEAEWDGGSIGDWYRETHFHGNSYHSNKKGQDQELLYEKLTSGSVLPYISNDRKDQHSTEGVEKSVDLSFLEKSILAKFDSDFDLDPDPGLDLSAKSVKNVNSNTKDFEDQWDSQYDFKELESPNKKGNATGKRRSSLPGQKVKEALTKGRDFIRAKVCSCRKKIFRSSVRMKTGENKDGSTTVIHSFDGDSNGIGDNDGDFGEKKSKQRNGVSINGHDVTARSDPEKDMSVKNDLDPNIMTETNDLEADGDASVEMSTCMNGNEVDLDLQSNSCKNETENMDADDFDPRKNRRKSIYLIEREETEIQDYGFMERQVSRNFKDDPDTDVTDSEPKSKITINIVKDDKEEEFPLGTEAQHFTESGRPIENHQIKDSRLLWLQGNSENRSFGSDFSHNTTTSNSSDISLDMLLQDRFADPEEVLTNLGFTSDSGDVISRVPNRFLSNSSGTDGALITSILEDNDQLQQLLSLSDHEDLIDQIQASQLSGNMNKQGKLTYYSLKTMKEKLLHLITAYSVPLHFLNVDRLCELHEFESEGSLSEENSDCSKEYELQNSDVDSSCVNSAKLDYLRKLKNRNIVQSKANQSNIAYDQGKEIHPLSVSNGPIFDASGCLPFRNKELISSQTDETMSDRCPAYDQEELHPGIFRRPGFLTTPRIHKNGDDDDIMDDDRDDDDVIDDEREFSSKLSPVSISSCSTTSSTENVKFSPFCNESLV